MIVDPSDETLHHKPLWVISGYDCFPEITCVRIDYKTHGYPCVWGHSVYRRSSGFRTLGLRLDEYLSQLRGNLREFYDDQDEAIERIRKLTTPKIPRTFKCGI